MVRDTFCLKFVALVECLQTFFELDAATFSETVDKAALDAVTFFQGDVSRCQSIVQERLENLVSQGGAQCGPSGSQGGPLSRSVDPDSEPEYIVVVHMSYRILNNVEN